MSASSPLDIAEINAMHDALPSQRDQAAFLLACGCGLRSGTLCALRIAHLLDRNHRLTGRLAIPRRNMKGQHQAHTVAIPKRALESIAIWIATHPAPHRQAPLWPSLRNPQANITPRQWHRIFTAAALAAGVQGNVSPHSARKFFAHGIYESTDKDIQLTTRALGNKSPMATLHYLDFGQRRITKATLEIFGTSQQELFSVDTPEHTSSSNTLTP